MLGWMRWRHVPCFAAGGLGGYARRRRCGTARCCASEQKPQLGPVPETVRGTHQVDRWSIALNTPSDKDRLLDEYIEWNSNNQEDDGYERAPYWADLWPSAKALAAELVAQPELAAGRAVLEVGAGLGLCGIVAGLLGARKVVLSDNDPLSLQVAARNVEDNLHLLGDAQIVHELLDWRYPETWPTGHGCVLGADVLYEPEFADCLAVLLPRIVAEHGTVLVADPVGRPNRDRFLGALRRHAPHAVTRVTRSQMTDQVVIVAIDMSAAD